MEHKTLTNEQELKAQEFKKKALNYHSKPRPGKVGTQILKPLKSRADFGLAYTPGVAHACSEIHKDKTLAYELTSKGNVVAVISNGTSVLGLGNIGAIAGKPVMEGKAVLFKYLAGIDGVDVEVDINNVEHFVEFLKAIAPSYGGINLEDVAAPECFAIDEAVHDKLNIPFFHDDQSGTAVVTTAAIQNALMLSNKKIEDVKIIVSGAGAAALSCVDFLIKTGARKENFYIFDSKGLINSKRSDLDKTKQEYAQEKDQTMQEALNGADIFLGLSKGNLLTSQDIINMAKDPIILAMANPTPEIMPEEVNKVRKDAIIGTGRSDFPNQVNNVLCFPFLFRGALDIRAKSVTLNMQLACCQAIMKTAQNAHNFDKDHIVPDAFDPTLIYTASYEVAQAAIKENNSQAPLPENYNDFLDNLLYGSTLDKTCEIPQINNDKGIDLLNILKIHGITKKSNKQLHVLSKEEIIEKAKEISNCIIVCENMEIGYNKTNLTLQTNDLIKTIETMPFIGLITENELLFDSSNRIWHAHKLCGANKA